MKIIIHRGSHQIGGCCTEIATDTSRILIDFGSELDGSAELYINGVTGGKSYCNAVLFSHYHGDHIGLMESINADIPLYDITKVSEFSWFWGQTLGLSVDENSFSKYGADVLIGGILYHITYFDRNEEEIKPLREMVEKEVGTNKTSQVEFYVAVNHQICEQLKNK